MAQRCDVICLFGAVTEALAAGTDRDFAVRTGITFHITAVPELTYVRTYDQFREKMGLLLIVRA